MDLLYNLFHQFLICLILNHVFSFLLSDIFPQIIHKHQSMFLHQFYLSRVFQQIPSHHSYPQDLFYQILSQHCLHVYVNSNFPLSSHLRHQTVFLHHFTCLFSLIRFLVVTHIHRIISSDYFSR